MRLTLKYGLNPNQKPAELILEGQEPLKILNGNPGYINFMDALNGWQLVRELKQRLNLPAAASFKHVSPAGAAVGLPLSDTLKKMYFAEQADPSPLCCAYIRARGADRLCSFGDFIALSDICDASTASFIAKEVSDGVIAPGYDQDALAILKNKRNGNYNIIEIDPGYTSSQQETRQIFGITFSQGRNEQPIDESLLQRIVTANKVLDEAGKRDLLLAMITLKYTQSNSVCYAVDGQTIGVGAGQQSRIHCTRLAGSKADTWRLRQHPVVLDLPFLPDIGRPARDNAIDLYLMEEECDGLLQNWQRLFSAKPNALSKEEKQSWLKQGRGVSLASDAFFPFSDNILRANRSGVQYIAQPGGSIRDDEVIAACNDFGMVMAFTGLRLFHH